MTDEQFVIDVAVGEATPADVGEGETTADGSFGFDADEQTIVTVRNPPWTEAFGTDTFLKYDVTVAKSLGQTYVKDGEEYTFTKPPEELRKAAWSFDNAPYPIGGHPDGGLLRDVEDIHGFVREPTYDEDNQEVHAALYVPATDEDAQEWIADNKGVSPGFWNRLDWDTEEDGVDAYQRNLRIDHVAGVEVGRCSVEDGCGITADDRTVGHVLADAPTRNKQDDTVPVGGQWVKFTDDGQTRYGRRLDEDEERTLVRLWDHASSETDAVSPHELRSCVDGRMTDRTVWVSTDSVALWAGPEADSCGGETCGCGCHIDADADVPMKDGTMYGVKPEENPDDEWKYRLGDCNDVKDAYNLRNNGDYDIATSTLVDRIKAAASAHDCPTEFKPWVDDSNMSEDNPDNPEMDFDEWVGGLTIDALAERNEAVAELQKEVDSLRDEKETLEDEKDALAEKVEDLQDSLREQERDEVAELVDEITSWTDAFGSEDELLEAYDEGEKSREAIESHHDTAKQIAEDMGVDLDAEESGGKRRSSPVDDGAVVSGDEGGEDTEYGHGGVYSLPAQ